MNNLMSEKQGKYIDMMLFKQGLTNVRPVFNKIADKLTKTEASLLIETLQKGEATEEAISEWLDKRVS